MSAHYNGESGSGGLEIQLFKIVQDVNRNIAHLKHCGLRQLARPNAFVDVPAHGNDGSNGRKLFDNFG